MLKIGVPIIVPPSDILRRGKRSQLRKKHEDTKPKTLKQSLEIQPNNSFGPLNRQAKSSKSFLSRFIEERFDLNRLSAEIRANLKNKATQSPAHNALGLLGTAIDYRLRAYFAIKPHACEIIASGFQRMEHIFDITDADGKVFKNTWRERKSTQGLSKILTNSLACFLDDVHPRGQLLDDEDEKKLCRFCTLLAHLDVVGRTSNFNSIKHLISIGSTNIDSMLSSVEPEIVADIVLLSRNFYDTHSHLIKNFRISTGGKSLEGSKDVIGADFDLIVDGCLFDFKTTMKPKAIKECLRQLIGYWLLDYSDKFRIRSLALCFTRQNYTHRFEIRDLLPSPRSFRQIRRTFRNELRAFNRRSKSSR